MTPDHFNLEMGRLYGNFGEKAFSSEKVKMIWSHWEHLPDQAFTRLVSLIISSHRQAPLPQDFIEAANKERARSFNKTAQAAANTFNWENQQGPKEYLAENYPGCTSIAEAVQIQIEVNQAKREREGSDGTR